MTVMAVWIAGFSSLAIISAGALYLALPSPQVEADLLYVIMDLRWLLAGAAALGLITGFVARRVSKPKRGR